MELKEKIVFHCCSEFEVSILNPVYELLKGDFSCIFPMDLGEVLFFKPNILILSNHHYHYFRGDLPKTIIVWTRHGFAGKNSLKKAIDGADLHVFPQ